MHLKMHPKPIPGVLPPLEYVAKYLVKDPRGSAHVFWRDGRANHSHDRDGQALLKWRVKATVNTRCVSQGVYVVVRLLMEHQKIPIEGAINVCGLPQCVNIEHWRAWARPAPLRLAQRAQGWCVVSARSGHEITAPRAVRISALDGTVHVARVAPGGPITLLCGAAIDPATSIIVEASVTCRAGC